jgi:saccharopine dehydrogenase-like NADP-dependent oxidoreductase
MKVVVVGGYGVFGGRLARLLIRDGLEVVVAGRDAERAAAFTREHGGTPLALDLDEDLSPIAAAAPDLVMDAAGPFQVYGADPYALARFCIGHGIDYLDLSDDGAFTAGIVALNGEAVAAGRFALSGASSVPAISAAAVAALSDGLSEIILIETAILPGNRAPRGRSVVASILHQAGAPMRLWRGGEWRTAPGWSDARRICLSPGLRRWASLIGAPDLTLFPAAFKARSVLFRAGLELGIMHRALTMLAFLRRAGLLRSLMPLMGLLTWIARTLEPFGTDRGGMVVEVVGVAGGRTLRRRWQLVAEDGSGPFVPAIPALAIARKRPQVPAGARSCVHDLTLAEIEHAMEGLPIRFERREESAPSLFETLLGESWPQLPRSMRRLHRVHDIESFSGRATVTRGSGLMARLIGLLFRFPKAGRDIPVTVTKQCTGRGETWERNFAGRIFRSKLSASPRAGYCREGFIPFTYELELLVRNGSLHLPVRRGWLFGLPLPAFLLPVSEAREYDTDGVFHFDVALRAPLGGGLIVGYEGWLAPDTKRRAARDASSAPVS